MKMVIARKEAIENKGIRLVRITASPREGNEDGAGYVIVVPPEEEQKYPIWGEFEQALPKVEVAK